MIVFDFRQLGKVEIVRPTTREVVVFVVLAGLLAMWLVGR